MLSAELGKRDRWVMAGLVVLGLFTLVAGVLSGRSATNYVLARDAHDAATSWAGKIDTKRERNNRVRIDSKRERQIWVSNHLRGVSTKEKCSTKQTFDL